MQKCLRRSCEAECLWSRQLLAPRLFSQSDSLNPRTQKKEITHYTAEQRCVSGTLDLQENRSCAPSLSSPSSQGLDSDPLETAASNDNGCTSPSFPPAPLSRWNTGLFDNSVHHITKCQHKTWAYIKAIIHLCLHLSLLKTILLSQKNCLGKSSPSLQPLPAPGQGKRKSSSNK